MGRGSEDAFIEAAASIPESRTVLAKAPAGMVVSTVLMVLCFGFSVRPRENF
jgi:hypothetical protein